VAVSGVRFPSFGDAALAQNGGEQGRHRAPPFWCEDAAVPGAVDPSSFRDALGRFVTGVCVVTSFGEEGPSGLTANAVSSLSLGPPLLLVCFDRSARTLAAVEHSRKFGVHFLARSQEEMAACFASKRPEPEKFEGIGWSERSGVPVIEGTLGGAVCELGDLVPGGDHVIGIGEVIDLWSSEGEPLVYYRGDYWSLSEREPAPPEVDEALEGG
jgi:flavin reductase (DIM6/NTAB) family NADH-FMN oxidoreductase RutF